MKRNKQKPEAYASGFAFEIMLLPQRFTHRGAGVCIGDGIEVAVDISRGTHIAMSEPFLDLLHWYALGKKHRGAGVAQIVESDLLQVMLLILLFDFRIHNFDNDPGSERKPSDKRLALCDALHLVGALSELFEDLFLIIHPFL